jgi:hypothetical protein
VLTDMNSGRRLFNDRPRITRINANGSGLGEWVAYVLAGLVEGITGEFYRYVE